MFIASQSLAALCKKTRPNIATPLKLKKTVKLSNQASASFCDNKQASSSEESKNDDHEFSSDSSIDDKHPSDHNQPISQAENLQPSKGPASDSSSNHDNFVKNLKFVSHGSSSTESSMNADRDLATYVQTVIGACSKQAKEPPASSHKVCKLSEHLKSYFELLKSTQSTIVRLQSQKEAELNSISRVFDKIRQEVDSKERLIKIQLTTIADN